MLNDYSKSAYIYDDNFKRYFNYPAACKKINNFINQHSKSAKTLLDVACGTGKHIDSLKDYYQVEGRDISSEMLKVARDRCPDILFHESCMMEFDLGKKYDVITCLYSSIALLKTLDNVKKAIKCMVNHLADGGLLLIEPWWDADQLWEGKLMFSSSDQPDMKICCMYIIKREGQVSIFDMHYMVGTEEGIETFVEREELGLFTQQQYTESLEAAGLKVHYYDTDLFPKHKYGLYVGIK